MSGDVPAREDAWLDPVVTAAVVSAELAPPERGPLVRRFTPTELVYHWVQALPYLVCLATGAAMLFWADGLHADVRDAAGALHRWAGGGMLVGIALVVLFGRRKELFRNARIAFTWTRDDFRWLALYPLEELGMDVHVPPVGKFNAGQKLNLLGQILLIPVFGVSGLLMWFTHGALLAWFVHVGAFCAGAPLVCGHLYLALVHRATRPGLPGAFGGFVPRDWAEEHYPRWVAEQDERHRRRRLERRVRDAVRRRLADDRTEDIA